MAFRSVSVVLVREVLRRWKSGEGMRTVAAATGTDRKTVRRYVEAAVAAGFARENGCGIDDALIDRVVADVLPGGGRDRGDPRVGCMEHRSSIEAWHGAGCKAPKIARLLQAEKGVVVPLRTLQRFLREEVAASGRAATVRLVEPDPGRALEIDFMSLGQVNVGDEIVVLSALVCVAAYSRHMFVWPCLKQTRQDVIDGLEAAWSFFGGVFPAVIADNPKALVTKADRVNPGLDERFLEYSQDRGFVLDLARVRRPKDKARVERSVQYVRSDAFAGERFVDLAHARRHAAAWCRDVAAHRVHGTTRRKPIEAFADEMPLLRAAPTEVYDPPEWTDVTVDDAQTVTVAGAIYSVPKALVRHGVRVRFDTRHVRIYLKNQVVKVHPRRPPGASCLDRADFTEFVADLATRDLESLRRRAAAKGEAIGRYAASLLDGVDAWTRARAVHRLLALCEHHGVEAVEAACRQALDLEVVDVVRIQRMLERRRAASPPTPAPASPRTPGRFARSAEDFRLSNPSPSEVTDDRV